MRRLQRRDNDLLDQAGVVLANAFYDDPGWIWTFPDPDVRRKAVSFIEPRLLRMHVPLGHSYAALDPSGTQVLAAAAWRPPGRELGMISEIRYGLVRVPFIVGLRSFRRMLHADELMRKIRKTDAPARQCWFLDTIGVAPEAQGRGIGSASLREVLRDVVDPSGAPATLFTTRPVNLRFYERAGFEVVREDRVGGEDGFTMWYMARPAS